MGKESSRGYNFNPYDPFASSFGLQGTITPKDLERISETILFDRAIERIANGVAHMPWTITPPKHLLEKNEEEAISLAEKLTKALREPNRDIHDTYTKLIKAAVRDLLVFGSATIERVKGQGDKSQPFWLWNVSVRDVKLDPDWDASREGIHPRFWYCPEGVVEEDWVPIKNENMFIVQTRTSTYQLVPPSPVRLAYNDMNTWLGLHEYQERTVNQAVRDYMICLEDETEEGVDSFREYWKNNVVGLGEIPIIAGKVSVVKFGARNDEELFPQYTNYLTGLLALEFGLSHRDFGLQNDDSYATADVAQAHSFQDAILPIAQSIIEHLDFKVIRFYAPDYILELSDIEPRKESEEAQVATSTYKEGILTKNEARRRLGEEPVEGGDEFAPPPGGNAAPGQEPMGEDQKSPEEPVEEAEKKVTPIKNGKVPKKGKGNEKNGKVPVAAGKKR